MSVAPFVLVTTRVDLARCPGCRSDLNLHQPDVELPDRLLATCRACRAWFLVRLDAETMIRLPHEADDDGG
jgi:hypothetical protein